MLQQQIQAGSRAEEVVLEGGTDAAIAYAARCLRLRLCLRLVRLENYGLGDERVDEDDALTLALGI